MTDEIEAHAETGGLAAWGSPPCAAGPLSCAQASKEELTMTIKFTKADVQGVATKLAKKKIERQPQRFGKIANPAAREAAARSEVYRENPELVDLDRAAR